MSKPIADVLQLLPPPGLSIVDFALWGCPKTRVQSDLPLPQPPISAYLSTRPPNADNEHVRACRIPPPLLLTALKEHLASSSSEHLSILALHMGRADVRLPASIVDVWIKLAKLRKNRSAWRHSLKLLRSSSYADAAEILRLLEHTPWDSKLSERSKNLSQIKMVELAGLASRLPVNDTAIDATLHMLELDLEKHGKSESVVIWDASRLTDIRSAYTMKRQYSRSVCKLMNRLKVTPDIKIAFILHIGGNHWVAVVIDNARSKILIGDSLSRGRIPTPTPEMRVFQQFTRDCTGVDFTVAELPIGAQTNSWSCGTFAVNALAAHLIPEEHTIIQQPETLFLRLKQLHCILIHAQRLLPESHLIPNGASATIVMSSTSSTQPPCHLFDSTAAASSLRPLTPTTHADSPPPPTVLQNAAREETAPNSSSPRLMNPTPPPYPIPLPRPGSPSPLDLPPRTTTDFGLEPLCRAKPTISADPPQTNPFVYVPMSPINLAQDTSHFRTFDRPQFASLLRYCASRLTAAGFAFVLGAGDWDLEHRGRFQEHIEAELNVAFGVLGISTALIPNAIPPPSVLSALARLSAASQLDNAQAIQTCLRDVVADDDNLLHHTYTGAWWASERSLEGKVVDVRRVLGFWQDDRRLNPAFSHPDTAPECVPPVSRAALTRAHSANSKTGTLIYVQLEKQLDLIRTLSLRIKEAHSLSAAIGDEVQSDKGYVGEGKARAS